MHNIQNNSRMAYEKVKKELTKKQMQVMACFGVRPDLTNRDIADIMGVAINNVTPRTCELKERKLIEHIGDRTVASKRKHAIYRLTDLGKALYQLKNLDLIKPNADSKTNTGLTNKDIENLKLQVAKSYNWPDWWTMRKNATERELISAYETFIHLTTKHTENV